MSSLWCRFHGESRLRGMRILRMRVWVRACAQVSCAPHRGGGPAGKLGACRRGAVGDLSSDGCDEGCDAGSAMRRVVIVLVRNARCDTRNHPGGGRGGSLEQRKTQETGCPRGDYGHGDRHSSLERVLGPCEREDAGVPSQESAATERAHLAKQDRDPRGC